MRGTQHLTMGIAAGILFSAALDIPAQQGCMMLSCGVGSLLPDIDIEESAIGHLCRPLSAFFRRTCGHRGFIHTPVCGVILTVLTDVILKLFGFENAGVIAAGLLVGYLLHLLQDTFTRAGIKWFYPIPFRIHFSNFRTKNDLFCWLITLILGIFMYWIAINHENFFVSAVKSLIGMYW